MSTEQNRKVAAELFARFDANDVAGALALMSEDCNYWIAGRRESTPSAGDHTKEEMARLFRAMTKAMPGGLRMKVLGSVAEGDRVALEVVSRGELANGRVYEQAYHVLVTVRDGKIAGVREYLDTQHVYDVWFRPEAAHA